MNPGKWHLPFLRRAQALLARSGPSGQLTGAAPATTVEELIQKLAHDRQSIALSCVEGRLADALFREQLAQGAWMVDIGVWGPALFRREAASIIAGMRPESGAPVPEESRPRRELNPV